MDLSRRHLLRGAAVTGAAIAASACGVLPALAAPTASVRKFTDPLIVPPFVDGTGTVELTVRNTLHSFHSSLPTAPSLAYQLAAADSPTYLGPTIVARRGVPTTVRVANTLTSHPLAAGIDPALHGTERDDADAPRTAVHLHGGNTAPASDGGPEDTFSPGAGYTYEYDNDQEAAGLWYHDHALGITRLNVHAGLAGGYLVRDGNDDGSGQTLPPPDFEIPLILQDKTFTRSGQQFYAPAPWAPEFFGDTPVVNGTAYPFLAVDRGQYRFRLYNGSNARFYRLSLKEKVSGAAVPFLQIGGDGGLLDRPVQLSVLLIAPGERADLVVDFRNLPAGAVVEMGNAAATPFPGPARKSHKGGANIGSIMQFRVTTAPGWDGTVSTATVLRTEPVQRLDALAAALGGDGRRTHSLIELFRPDGLVRMATLNNRTFDNDDYQQHPVSAGSVEVWEFANTTMDTHPIHLHLVQFQVLDREPFDAAAYLAQHYPPDAATGLLEPNTGPYPAPSADAFSLGPAQPPAVQEMGWKDTVQAPPGMITRIVVPFGQAAVPDRTIAAPRVHTGDYVWHCHILEHEDNDMMQKYRIV